VSAIHDAMKRDYPLLWEKANEYDFAERLGGCGDPLMAEIDEAMREIFSARTRLPRPATDGGERVRPRFDRKLDGKRHVFRELRCWLGFHSPSVMSTSWVWCWYCGEDIASPPRTDPGGRA
jgi:hypothetical protein